VLWFCASVFPVLFSVWVGGVCDQVRGGGFAEFRWVELWSWEQLLAKLSQQFPGDGDIDLDGVLLLIGAQELQMGYLRLKKDEKLNVLHIAVCTVLEPYGYYEFEKRDDDGWPHFKSLKPLPNLKAGEQAVLMKEAVVNYFKTNGYL
jgi:hypothetical protein